MISHSNFYFLICPGIIRLSHKMEAKEIITWTCIMYAKHMFIFINQIHIRAGRRKFCANERLNFQIDESDQIRMCTGDWSSWSSGEDYYFDYAQLSVNKFMIQFHKLNKGIDHAVILNLYTRWRWWMSDDAKYNIITNNI